MARFSLTQKVQFQHCDPAGIVFYPRYFEMLNTTVEEWFSQCLEMPFERIHGEMGAAVPTASLDIVFLAPSRHGEYLDFYLEPVKIGKSSLRLLTEVWCKSEKRLSMNSTIVFVPKNNWMAQTWPADIRNKISSEIERVVSKNA